MTPTAVSLEEYLRTDYSPDVDYVDGEIEVRNWGEWEHARLQALILRYLMEREKRFSFIAVPEQRVQVAVGRFRVPDIAVVRSRPLKAFITDPPLLCIEILSPQDTLQRVRRRIHDYLDLGVPCVWIVDPNDQRAEIWTPEGMREIRDGVLTAGEITVPLAELIDSDRE